MIPRAAKLYQYHGWNRQIWASIDGAEASYAYRPDGQTSGGNTATHLWDGSNIVADIGSSTTKYLRGLNLLMSTDAVNGSRYYLYNAHGDVVHLTNATNGTVSTNYGYDAFGNLNDAFDFLELGMDFVKLTTQLVFGIQQCFYFRFLTF